MGEMFKKMFTVNEIELYRQEGVKTHGGPVMKTLDRGRTFLSSEWGRSLMQQQSFQPLNSPNREIMLIHHLGSFDRHNAKGTEKAIAQCYAHSCK